MKVSCTKKLVDLHDKPIVRVDSQEPATFRSVATESLLSRQANDDGAKGYRCYALAVKINSADFVELTVEELALIKERVGSLGYSNHLVLGRMFDLLEGKV